MSAARPDPSDMVYFAEVVQRGGFAAAGRHLNMPRSRLSRRIAVLEEQLGVRLLQRTTRTLSLTHAGEAFLEHCKAVRDAVQAATRTAADSQSGPKGLVRVACPVTLAQSALGELIPDFLMAYPDVQLEMHVSNRVVNVVEEGMDIALRIRNTLDNSGSYIVKKLDTAENYLVASPALLRRYSPPATPDELLNLPSIAMEQEPQGKASLMLVGPDETTRTLQHKPRFISDDLMTLRFAALAGTGWCWLPDYMCVPELREGRLLRLLPDWEMKPGIVHAVFPSHRGMAPAVRCFLDFLGAYLPGRTSLAQVIEIPAPQSGKAVQP